jgi:molybdopterin-containing oxidoreductase family iron-sulfur binding subunit
MNEDRRRFLKQAGRAVVGLGWGLPLLAAGCTTRHGGGGGGEAGTQWAMVVDIEKCRDEAVRRACIEACHRVHNVPDIPESDDEVKWIWTEKYPNAFPDQVHDRDASMREAPVLVMCNHCTRPPCTKVCPTKATWRRESDGIVMMDMHRCIGCRYCIAACPYGSRSFNWKDPRDYIEKGPDGEYVSNYPTRAKGVVEKCNFCAERLRDGLKPACVEAANALPQGTGALTFGDLDDRDSEVSKIVREKHTICRRVSLGTGPNVYYII